MNIREKRKKAKEEYRRLNNQIQLLDAQSRHIQQRTSQLRQIIAEYDEMLFFR